MLAAKPLRALQGSTDESLMLAARDGDHDAFAVLYRRWEDDVYRCQKSRTCSEDLADQATVETFVLLWQMRERYKPGQFRRLLFTLARYARLSVWESLRRARLVSSETPVVDRSPRAPEIVERRETAAIVRSRVAEIATPKEAEAIEAYYLAGETGVEAAAKLRVTKQAIGLRLQRSMTWLRADEALAALL